MLGRTTGLLCLLAVLSWTTVYGQSSENLGSLIDEVFGPPPSEQTGDGGAQPVNNNDNNDNNNNNNNNNEDTRGNEALTDTGSNAGNGLGGEKCLCVPYYLCANNSIITDGTGLLDIRIKAEQCENYMDVCCGEPLEPENAIKPKPHGRLGCGKRNVDGVGFRITGNVNNEAQFGEFPWMVAVLKEDILDDGSKLNIYQCGGSLIHEQVVLTAAHCVIGKAAETIKVRVGEWDTQTSNELYPHQDRQVAQIITHEKYYSGALHNDVALLVLRDPIEFADNVDITCLPLQGDVILNNECYASGWGKDVFESKNSEKDKVPSSPGNDGDLGTRFLTSRRNAPLRNSQQTFQNGWHQRQQRNFGQGLFQGIGGHLPTTQPNFFAQGLFQGFQQQRQQQQPNIIGGFLQGLQNQRHQHQSFVDGTRESIVDQQKQQNDQQQNFAKGILQGITGILEKKTEFIKSKTEELIQQLTPKDKNKNTADNIPFITKESEPATSSFAPPTSIPTATPTVPGKEGHYQVILKRVDLPMVPRDKCEAELRKTRLGPYFRLHDSFVCAGGVVGKDTCKGDGGSPLVCPIPGRDYQYQQVGIVAWGIGCGNETPAVYVNVAQFRDWIDNHMRKLNFKFEYNY